MHEYQKDIRAASVPFNLVYTTDSANDSLDTFNKLLISCIERHAPLKRIKVTRPPAAWLRDLNINCIQKTV